MTQRLSTNDHSRDVAGLTYVYPVISRRAGGLSIGINFNTNNACNWRCIYCQVPGLTRGSAPSADLSLLADELNYFLDQVLNGDFFERFEVPQDQRIIKDIAISGNGEPTSLPGFADAVSLIGRIATEKKVFPDSRFVLISNGSLMHQKRVQDGLRQLSRYGGEVWFKLDSATTEGRKKINNCVESDRKVLENIGICANLCRTKLQTCLLNFKQYPWSESEQQAYLALLARIRDKKIRLEEILFYGLARPSQQPEANQLEKLSEKQIAEFAEKVKAIGYPVSISC